jgi:CPA2 family monovalent cation:H+ antiporter-2
MGLRELFRSRKDCDHVSELVEVEPDSPDSCLQCVEMGDTWVNLRVCLNCGHVGCCDASKNKHATAHHKETGHPMIQSYQPDETWRYCYVDDQRVTDADSPARR